MLSRIGYTCESKNKDLANTNKGHYLLVKFGSVSLRKSSRTLKMNKLGKKSGEISKVDDKYVEYLFQICPFRILVGE